MIFTTEANDQNGRKAAAVLEQLGYRVELVSGDERARPDAVALFTPLNVDNLQGGRGRYLRTSSIKLTDCHTPAWAQTTPLRVGVIRTERGRVKAVPSYVRRRWGFPGAVETMAEGYRDWLSEGSTALVPWGTDDRDPTVADNPTLLSKLRSWREDPTVDGFRTLNVVVRQSYRGVTTIPVGAWQVNTTKERRIFPADAAAQALALLERWQTVFKPEATWVRTEKGLPSLFVRLDCIVRDGTLVVYEVEERPAGIGISSLVNQDFGDQFRRVAGTWQPFKVVVSPLRRATDDQLWHRSLPWGQSESPLVLVRAEPEEQQFHRLEPVSVSSLIAKGDKGYGVPLGLWREVRGPDELDWSKSFVLKPLQGSKLRDLEIWDPEHRPGSSVRPKVEHTLRTSGAMFCQQLFPPMETGIPQFPWMIYRMFFGFDCGKGRWVALGGNWNARANLRIHGASDAVFGPAVVE